MHVTALSRRMGVLLLLGTAAASARESTARETASPAPAFAGAWRIASGEPAGIDGGAPAATDAALLGATVTFGEGVVEAPRPLGCTHARYEARELPADGLFQGTLGAAAAARAQALGLSATATPTLMLRCDSGLFDYHLRQGSSDTATRLLIMLDRVIYTLERSADAPAAP